MKNMHRREFSTALLGASALAAGLPAAAQGSPVEGTHYVRPFGGRKILFLWEAIERDMICVGVAESRAAIPMANGAVLHG